MPELVKRVVLLLTLVALAIGTASALAAGAVSHGDPIAPVILGVTGLLFVALIGRFSARIVARSSDQLGALVSMNTMSGSNASQMRVNSSRSTRLAMQSTNLIS